MSYEDWERDVYPKVWRQAYAAGETARDDGLPRTCNLGESYCHNGKVLKVYKSAWEQGWDKYTISAIFGQVEVAIGQMPLQKVDCNDCS